MAFLIQQQQAFLVVMAQVKDMAVTVRSLTDAVNGIALQSNPRSPEVDSSRKRMRSNSSLSPQSSSSSSSSSAKAPSHDVVENLGDINVAIDIPIAEPLDRKTPCTPFVFPDKWGLDSMLYEFVVKDLIIAAHCELKSEQQKKTYRDIKLIITRISECGILTQMQKDWLLIKRPDTGSLSWNAWRIGAEKHGKLLPLFSFWKSDLFSLLTFRW